MENNMDVQDNRLVEIDYSLRLNGGTPAELPGQPSPLRFAYGSKKVLPGLQAALRGMRPTESCEVELSAEEAFGAPSPSQTVRMKRERFPEGLDLYVGRRVSLRKRADGSSQAYFVSNIEPDYVELVNNHPFAGEDLHFSVTVLDVSPAS